MVEQVDATSIKNLITKTVKWVVLECCMTFFNIEKTE